VKNGYDEALVLNDRGYVAGGAGNIFWCAAASDHAARARIWKASPRYDYGTAREMGLEPLTADQPHRVLRGRKRSSAARACKWSPSPNAIIAAWATAHRCGHARHLLPAVRGQLDKYRHWCTPITRRKLRRKQRWLGSGNRLSSSWLVDDQLPITVTDRPVTMTPY
jgi:hypothetical protein